MACSRVNLYLYQDLYEDKLRSMVWSVGAMFGGQDRVVTMGKGGEVISKRPA